MTCHGNTCLEVIKCWEARGSLEGFGQGGWAKPSLTGFSVLALVLGIRALGGTVSPVGAHTLGN